MISVGKGSTFFVAKFDDFYTQNLPKILKKMQILPVGSKNFLVKKNQIFDDFSNVRARENQKLLCLGKFSCFCYFS
jgi:hypothetical protein